MSRIGKQPVTIPAGVDVVSENGVLKVSRGETELRVPLLAGISYALQDGAVSFSAERQDAQTRRNWGTVRSLFANAVRGVTEGYEKTLILEGVGYRVALLGSTLTLSLGFSHPVVYEAPAGITFVTDGNTLRVKGHDRQLVGQVAAEIRKFRKAEPYKGKGFRYSDEVVRRKAGKKAASSAG